MNKNEGKANTEVNNNTSKLNITFKNKSISVESKNNKKPDFKDLKFKNIIKTPKKEEILASKSKIIFHINKIFFNIAQYSIKEKDYLIKKYQLMDILKQSNVICPEMISLNQTDIILTKLYPHKTKFNFSEFMNFLTELCHFLYQDKFENSPKNAMDNFLSCLYNNYKEIIIEKNSNNFMETLEDNSCTLKCIETIISSKLERPIFKLMLTLYDKLVKIFKAYFPNEVIKYKSINEEKITAESSQNLFIFFQDFEIFPSVMNKVNLNMYFNLLMKYLKEKCYINKVIISFGENSRYTDLGICFKLSSFILCLYHFSIFYHFKRMKFQTFGNSISYDSIHFDECLIDVDKIIFFFRKLENSNGIKKYIYKRGRTNENRFNFILKKKDIKIAKNEMNVSFYKETENDLSKKYKDNKRTIESSPYYTPNLIEEKSENKKNDDSDSFFLASNKNTFSNEHFKRYFLNTNKKENYLLSISDLDEILSVSSIVKEEIINKIEKLSEIFLKYSKINNKLEYNRMSYSSFLKFLSDADLLLEVPEKKRILYRKISDNIMSKTLTVSSIKIFENDLKCSVCSNNVTLTKEEVDYKKNILKLVNTSNKIKNKDKIKMTEASLIFSSVTGAYNYPSYLNSDKKQFNKIEGLNDIKKTASFEPKNSVYSEKDFPKKMNFILFLKSFELIANKLYPKILLDDAVTTFLDLKIEPFIIKIKKINLKNTEITKALKKINNKDLKEILEQLGDIVYPFYLKFTDNKEQIQFYQFFEFYINLELFPEMISLTQMKNIFYSLCEKNLNDNETLETDNNIKNKIDFKTFIKSLGISSLLFNFRNLLSDKDRILYIYYFILKSNFMKNINDRKNILIKISKNLKDKHANKIKRNSSIDNLNNRKIILNYDNRTNEYKYVEKKRKIYNFYDVYE